MIAGVYYDGRTARAYAVRVAVGRDGVRMEGDGIERFVPLEQTKISERLGSAPRKLSFPDGAICELRDHEAFEAQLRLAGIRAGYIDRLQRSTRAGLMALVVTILLGVAGYIWGLPGFAAWAARAIPEDVTALLSEQTLALFDKTWFEDSQLSDARKTELESAFARLQPQDGALHYRLLFRSSPTIGPNAFALPNGDIVLLDELVNLASDDEQVLAVLGHELGHVHHRHGLRLLIQGALTGTLIALWLGDTNSLLVALPTILAQAHYSRTFESEADAYGVALLRVNGIAPERFAEILEKLSKAPDSDAVAAPAQEGWADYLASHPAPASRIRALREGRIGQQHGP